jgi:hypothetical protein
MCDKNKETSLGQTNDGFVEKHPCCGQPGLSSVALYTSVQTGGSTGGCHLKSEIYKF